MGTRIVYVPETVETEISLSYQDITDITVALFRESQSQKDTDHHMYAGRCAGIHDKLQLIRKAYR
jgi:hypothetical protein